ncbi:hypothetical protein PybrP1_000143, partial [[Pythium] brassicae (nom. inval.)]
MNFSSPPRRSVQLGLRVQQRLTAVWTRRQLVGEPREVRLDSIQLRSLWFRVIWLAFFALRFGLFIYLALLCMAYRYMSQPIFDRPRTEFRLPEASELRKYSAVLALGAVVTVHKILFGRKGLLGLEHPYFVQLLALRELSEIILQGYQTYTSTTLVSRRWISDAAVALLVLNCWSTLLVHALGPKTVATERVLCLVVDMVLDLGWSLGIPFSIAIRYLRAYDREMKTIPDHLLANYAWNLGWQMDIQQFCFTSWLDFASSMLPCASILVASRSVAGMVEEKRVSGNAESPILPLPFPDPMRPWFTHQFACAYANINLSRGDGGSANEVEKRLSVLGPQTLRYLVLSHAANLTVPMAIAAFSNLLMMEIYNTTALVTHDAPF